ncbi:MAG: hypothetical protein AABZ31_12195 [Bdellovibrionota bacterium]
MNNILTYILLAFLFSPLTYAQDEAAAPAAKPSAKSASTGGAKKTTDINFEDELIEGEVKKPELMYLLQKKQFNFKRLIKLRENFLPEMNRTSESIQRVRGVN